MESLFQTIKAKGISTTIRKIMLNFKRYHFGIKKTMRRFEIIADVMEKYNAKMTIHVPAVLMEHYSKYFKKINDKNIEWALHGFKHIDHSKLTYDGCFEQLKKAKEIFEYNGITPKGFRAPYLRIGDHVVKAISKLDLIYDSSTSVFLPVVDIDNPKVKSILEFYNTSFDWELKKKYNVIQLPVILPDDEILVDRLGFKKEKIGEIWLKMAKTCLEKKWIFVLQLHPDRVEPCSTGLKMVLEWANKNKIWLPSLPELALEGGIKRGYDGAIALTGDLDLLTIWDYYRIS